MRPNILKAKGHKVEENQKTWKSFPRFQNSANEIISFARVLGHNVADTMSATFTEDTASKIGVSPRTIRRDAQKRDI